MRTGACRWGLWQEGASRTPHLWCNSSKHDGSMLSTALKQHVLKGWWPARRGVSRWCAVAHMHYALDCINTAYNFKSLWPVRAGHAQGWGSSITCMLCTVLMAPFSF
eukprot:scaffold61012_cov19-Tisochrysis_lutea.AAC.1